jgi:hypothetical protein
MSDIRIIVCPDCQGDGGFECLGYDYDHNTGAPQTFWQKCNVCDAKGEIEQRVEPIEIEDLEAPSP